jgi:hypothetical protein
MMEEWYDEAWIALKRALVVDPNYTIAKNNLGVILNFADIHSQI